VLPSRNELMWLTQVFASTNYNALQLSEDGQLYTAVTSSNTCATVNVCISSGRAAWEILLEADTLTDECSIFGCATKPLRRYCTTTHIVHRLQYV
jgi:hypothetical protein